MLGSGTQIAAASSGAVSVSATSERGAYLFTATAAFFLVLYLTNVGDYFYQHAHEVKPLYWNLLVVLVACTALLVRPEAVIHRFPKSALIWIGLFLIVLLVSFLRSRQNYNATERLFTGLQTAALLFSFVVLLLPEAHSRFLLKVLLIIVIFSVSMNLYDFFAPTYSKTPGRAAGFYSNPNFSGRIIALCMVLSCLVVPRRLRAAFCLFVGAGILVTFSRSSWLLWAVGVTGLAATGHLFLRSRAASLLLIGGLSILVVAALFGGVVFDIFRTSGLDQYLTDGTVSRLGGTGDAFADDSAGGRMRVAFYSLAEFQKHPWFGAGLGATLEWVGLHRPHNLYLLYAVEAGVFGLVLLATLLIILWVNANPIGRVATVVFMVSSIFTHNNLEIGATLLILAFILTFYRRDIVPAQNASAAGTRRE